MKNNIVDSKVVILQGTKYKAYLKKVASSVLPGGKPSSYCVRPFIKKIRSKN